MTITEIVEFRLKDGVEVDDFLAAAARVAIDYQPHQPGYLAGSRRTRRSSDGTWSVTVDWASRQDAEASKAAFGMAGEVTAAFVAALDSTTMRIEVQDLFVMPES